MSFHLIRADRDRVLASDCPIIRAADRVIVQESIALFDTLSRERTQQQEAAERAEREATDRGFAAGETAGLARFAEAIATLAQEAQAQRDWLEAQVAELALIALQRMVDTLDDEAMVRGIARRAVADLVASGPVTVEVSEAVAPAVEQALADLDADGIIVRPDPALDDTQCRVTAGDSRIIADRDVQLAAIRERLELADGA